MADEPIPKPKDPLTKKVRRVIYWFIVFLANATGHIPVHTIRHALYKYIFRIKMGKSAIIYCGCRFLKPSTVSLGNHSIVENGVFLDGRKGLRIGNNVIIGCDAQLRSKYFHIECPNMGEMGNPIVIKDFVHIGARAIVLPGVTIGEGAVVGPGSVVKENVAPWTIAEGVPAKYVKDRLVKEYKVEVDKAYFQ